MTDETMTQEQLIPEVAPTYDDEQVLLEELPDSDELVGAEPDDMLVENIRRYGLQHAVVLNVRSTGQYEVISGRRRVKAYRILRDRWLDEDEALHGPLEKRVLPETPYDRIPARVVRMEGPVTDAMILSANATARPNPIQEFLSIERLVNGGASLHDISVATGMSSGTIKKRMALGRAPQEFISAAQNGVVSASVVEAVAKLPHAYQQNLVERLLWCVSHGEAFTLAEVQHVRQVDRAAQIAAIELPSVPELLPETPSLEPENRRAERLPMTEDEMAADGVTDEEMIAAAEVLAASIPVATTDNGDGTFTHTFGVSEHLSARDDDRTIEVLAGTLRQIRALVPDGVGRLSIAKTAEIRRLCDEALVDD